MGNELFEHTHHIIPDVIEFVSIVEYLGLPAIHFVVPASVQPRVESCESPN